jgi:hypothetical protein
MAKQLGLLRNGKTARKRVGIVACASCKLTKTAPASEIYTSPLFKKAKAWVEQNTDEWAILSAKHGLVMPSTRLRPYDLSLNDLNSQQVRTWVAKVQKQLRARWNPAKVEFVVLAGRKYRGPFDAFTYTAPMAGLGIGQQLKWLNEALSGEDAGVLLGRDCENSTGKLTGSEYINGWRAYYVDVVDYTRKGKGKVRLCWKAKHRPKYAITLSQGPGQPAIFIRGVYTSKAAAHKESRDLAAILDAPTWKNQHRFTHVKVRVLQDDTAANKIAAKSKVISRPKSEPKRSGVWSKFGMEPPADQPAKSKPMANRTFAQARWEILEHLQSLGGWTLSRTAKVPIALAPGKAYKIYFKPQSIYIAPEPPFSLRNAQTAHVGDLRTLTGPQFVGLVQRWMKPTKRAGNGNGKNGNGKRNGNGNGNGNGTKITDNQAVALAIVLSRKSSYRGDEFRKARREGFAVGKYTTDNPLIQALVKKGFLAVNRAGSIVQIKDKKPPYPGAKGQAGSELRMRAALTPSQWDNAKMRWYLPQSIQRPSAAELAKIEAPEKTAKIAIADAAAAAAKELASKRGRGKAEPSTFKSKLRSSMPRPGRLSMPL